MESLKEYLVPVIVSNIVFAGVLVAAWIRPMWARIFLAFSFLGASAINAITSMKTPEVYLQYGKMAIPPFRDFIYGFFSEHIPAIVLAIATCQFLICLGLILNKTWMKAACLGGTLFGLAISPLGVGSAFPATVFLALSFFVLFRRCEHDFIWKWKQYRFHLKSLVL